jgi:hypothetical protein
VGSGALTRASLDAGPVIELEERLRRELGRAPWPEEVERAWMKEHGIDFPGDAYWDLR